MTDNLTPPTFDSQARDEYYWKSLDAIMKEREYSTQDILRHWQAYILRRDLPRFPSH